ncbi:MAG: hypothetical protein F6J98_36495 [Moorea sp. SIO4G2]|nr:hypothetical protein [Moorena sp. SIO4G2]
MERASCPLQFSDGLSQHWKRSLLLKQGLYFWDGSRVNPDHKGRSHQDDVGDGKESIEDIRKGGGR